MLHAFDPRLADKPQLRENSFNRILRLEASYARFFWPRYFAALATDLFEREHRKAKAPHQCGTQLRLRFSLSRN
jgi:hypothetical protein